LNNFDAMLVVLNNFLKNLFITKYSDLRPDRYRRSKGASPCNNVGIHYLAQWNAIWDKKCV